MSDRVSRLGVSPQRRRFFCAVLTGAAALGLALPCEAAPALVAKRLEPAMLAVAQQAEQRGLLVLTVPAADSMAENWGLVGVIHDESVRLLVKSQARVLVSPKVMELIENGEIRGPLGSAGLNRIRSLATFDLLLVETYRRSRAARTVDLVLAKGANGQILWKGKVAFRESEVQPGPNLPELNRKVVAFASSRLGQQVGNGECWTLAADACKEAGANLTAVYSFGRKLGPLDSPLPGDIIQFEQARFKARLGFRTVPHHTAVIEKTEGATVLEVLHQNMGEAGKTVSRDTFHLEDKIGGTVAIFRPRPRVFKAVEPKPAEEPSSEEAAAVDVPLGGTAKLPLRPIPAGTFRMGPTERDDVKRSQVTLSRPFYLGVTEVTQAQWKAVMGANPSEVRGNDLPVTNVSWTDVQKFLAVLNRSAAGRQFCFRLPTDAEWEYACRAGTTTRYGCGEDDLDLPEFGWFADNSGGRAHAVARLRPNRWGLYDMHGNVWELIQDFCDANPTGTAPAVQVDPQGPPNGKSHVIRGGAFDSAAGACTCGNRARITPVGKSLLTGFRLAAVSRGEGRE